jgi:hypothetical protein
MPPRKLLLSSLRSGRPDRPTARRSWPADGRQQLLYRLAWSMYIEENMMKMMMIKKNVVNWRLAEYHSGGGNEAYRSQFARVKCPASKEKKQHGAW